MKNILILAVIIVLVGCSSGHLASPGADEPADSFRPAVTAGSQWIWGAYTIAVSADRNEAVLLPSRTASFFYNITPFVEGPPCSDCLWLGKPHVQPDGTIELKVNLRHPFFGHPKYTGFDVRGICVFKATDYMKDISEDLYSYFPYIYEGEYATDLMLNYPPLYYADPYNGGAALLNADGYTFYLNPVFEFLWLDGPNKSKAPLPIFNYTKAEHAFGDDVDTTVNPYKLFADTSPRRMFKHSDLFSRTYHIKPPDGGGAFQFGYVVSACWTPPLKTPVTNPETDFPLWANCEDAYSISVVQLTTCTNESYDNYEPIFKATIKHRADQRPQRGAQIISSTFLKATVPGLGDDNEICFYCNYFGPGNPSYHPEDFKEIDEETTELVFRANEDLACGAYDVVPGWHLGILVVAGERVQLVGNPDWPLVKNMFTESLSVRPVMIYAE